MKTSNMPKAVFNWLGSKRKIMPLFEQYIPNDIYNCYVPFIGAGSSFIYLLHKHEFNKIYIIDINPDLTNFYTFIKNGDSLDLFVKDLEKLYMNNDKEQFMKIRDTDELMGDLYNQSLRFVYICNACYNNSIVYNKEGKIRNSYASGKNLRKVTLEQLESISLLLERAEVILDSYEWILTQAKKGDFVYLDPPYHWIDENKKKAYITYVKESVFDQYELFKFCNVLNHNRIKFIQSNSNSDWIWNMYKRYDIYEVIDKNKAKEVFITNCKCNNKQRTIDEWA